MDQRVVNSRWHLLILTLSVLTVDCSSGSSSTTDYNKALTAAEAAVQPPTAEWATSVATEADRQVHDLGAIDSERLRSGAERKAGPVKDAACTAIRKKQALSSEKHFLDTQNALGDSVTRETAAAFGRFPLALYSLKTTWPPSWLAEPSRQPDYSGPAQSADSLYLKPILAPRFVGVDGSFVVPDKASPDYPNFIAWMKQSSNEFAGFVSVLTNPITEAISTCLTTDGKK
jgi:hypothetical protein